VVYMWEVCFIHDPSPITGINAVASMLSMDDLDSEGGSDERVQAARLRAKAAEQEAAQAREDAEALEEANSKLIDALKREQHERAALLEELEDANGQLERLRQALQQHTVQLRTTEAKLQAESQSFQTAKEENKQLRNQLKKSKSQMEKHKSMAAALKASMKRDENVAKNHNQGDAEKKEESIRFLEQELILKEKKAVSLQETVSRQSKIIKALHSANGDLESRLKRKIQLVDAQTQLMQQFDKSLDKLVD